MTFSYLRILSYLLIIEVGATITQQMIKIIYLNNSKTIKRKSNETFNDY